jgi:hypothetical protein
MKRSVPSFALMILFWHPCPRNIRNSKVTWSQQNRRVELVVSGEAIGTSASVRQESR